MDTTDNFFQEAHGKVYNLHLAAVTRLEPYLKMFEGVRVQIA
jgi:hypothetical protein